MTDDEVSQAEPSAPQNSGADDLDALLSEFQSSVGSDADRLLADHDAETRGFIERAAQNAPPGSIDELVNDKYWELRSQASHSHNVTEQAQRKIDELNRLQENIAAQEAHKKHVADLNQLVKDVRGEFDPERWPDDLMIAWIDAKANANQDYQRIWLERDANPQAFKQIQQRLARDFFKSASRAIDPNATEDRAAVAAAVRGASMTNRAPEPPPSYGRQSNNDFRNSVAEEFGFDPLS